jgi:hypothetical protein
MIAIPSGWHRELLGEELIVTAPSGARFTYRERGRPLAALPRLVLGAVARDPSFVPEELSPPLALVTHEGEHAMVVTVRGRREGSAAAMAVGLVLLDEHYACLVGDDPDEVARILQTDRHALGTRPRRFHHDVPAGWLSRTVAGETTWWPAEESLRASITVWSAVPLTDVSRARVATMVEVLSRSGEFGVAERRGPIPIQTRGGLEGTRWDLVGSPVTGARQRRTVVFLRDDRFFYAARLEAWDLEPAPQLEPLFLALVDSFEPVPRPLAEPAWTE